VLPVTADVVNRARGLLDEHGRIMARDALHAAVVLEHELEGICSFDRDFDGIEGVRRYEPAEVGPG
jgi:predicted nucleic acid-binding protein